MLLDIEPKYGSCNETYLGEGEGSAGAPRCCKIYMSSIGSFSYDCTKWLSDSLSELRHHETCVKDTLNFLSLRQNRSSSGKIVTSFDVTSLFTNVPVDFIINLILDSVFRINDEFNGLNRRRMKKLLEWVVKTTTFQFNGRFYRQVDGVAMGSP